MCFRDVAISFRLERDRLAIEAKYEHERFEDLKKEVEHQVYTSDHFLWSDKPYLDIIMITAF